MLADNSPSEHANPSSPTKAPALAIAVFVRERGAAYSGEILNHF
jgi:hypothetical protein